MINNTKKIASLTLSFVILASVTKVGAQIPSSSNYSVQESGFSSGSSIDANSANFNARVSAGELGIGQSESGNYIGFGGFITPDQEYVELNIPVTNINLGVLTPGVAATTSATFTARAYLDSNYIIISPRDAPTSENGDIIDPITSAAAFNTAQEQFGINLVANTSPSVIGANPTRQPVDDSTFAYGVAAAGYNTANLYQYNQGDVIAESVIRGYGQTDYTITYLFNTTPTTPSGTYRIEQDLVITATF